MTVSFIVESINWAPNKNENIVIATTTHVVLEKEPNIPPNKY